MLQDTLVISTHSSSTTYCIQRWKHTTDDQMYLLLNQLSFQSLQTGARLPKVHV